MDRQTDRQMEKVTHEVGAPHTNNEERAKSTEAKIVNLNTQLQSCQETLREEQNKITMADIVWWK